MASYCIYHQNAHLGKYYYYWNNKEHDVEGWHLVSKTKKNISVIIDRDKNKWYVALVYQTEEKENFITAERDTISYGNGNTRHEAFINLRKNIQFYQNILNSFRK